jgi:hypothetical protein
MQLPDIQEITAEEVTASQLGLEPDDITFVDPGELVYITECTPGGSDTFDTIYVMTDGTITDDPDQPVNTDRTGDFYHIIGGGTYIVVVGIRHFKSDIPKIRGKYYIEQVYLRPGHVLSRVADRLSEASVA